MINKLKNVVFVVCIVMALTAQMIERDFAPNKPDQKQHPPTTIRTPANASLINRKILNIKSFRRLGHWDWRQSAISNRQFPKSFKRALGLRHRRCRGGMRPLRFHLVGSHLQPGIAKRVVHIGEHIGDVLVGQRE